MLGTQKTLRRSIATCCWLMLALLLALANVILLPAPALSNTLPDIWQQPVPLGQAKGFWHAYSPAQILSPRQNSAGNATLALDYAQVIDGGPNANGTVAIGSDSAGNIYVIGNSSDPYFQPPATGYGTGDVYDNCYFGCSYVIKYGPSLNPVYTAIIPASEALSGTVNSAGEVYLAGRVTNLGFPVTPGAWNTTGDWTGFITKLNAAGTALVYSTYVSGDIDGVDSIAIDPNGNSYFLVDSADVGFSVTSNAMQGAYPGGVQTGGLGELSADGSSLLYGTFVGGSGTDSANALYLDSAQSSIYVTGTTDSTNFPVTQGNYHGGDSDGFVLRIQWIDATHCAKRSAGVS